MLKFVIKVERWKKIINDSIINNYDDDRVPDLRSEKCIYFYQKNLFENFLDFSRRFESFDT